MWGGGYVRNGGAMEGGEVLCEEGRAIWGGTM